MPSLATLDKTGIPCFLIVFLLINGPVEAGRKALSLVSRTEGFFVSRYYTQQYLNAIDDGFSEGLTTLVLFIQYAAYCQRSPSPAPTNTLFFPIAYRRSFLLPPHHQSGKPG